MIFLSKFLLAFTIAILPSWGDNSPINDLPGQELTEALSSLKDGFEEDTLNFYRKRGDQPVWFFQGNLTKCGHTAVDALRKANEEGLNPHDYEDAVQAADRPDNWVKAEILLTRRYLEFINHLRVGRVDPARISHDIKFHSPKTDAVELLLDGIQDKSTDCAKLGKMEPSFPQYAHLKKILANYRDLSETTKEWPKIRAVKALKLGDVDPEVKVVRRILALQGDLKDDNRSSLTFDKKLDAAVRQFQRRSTLEADGVVGGKTKEALNQPIEALIRKVIYNMERLRWLPEDLGNKHIIVNVAGYQLWGYEQSNLNLTIPAIIGRPSRRTPLFYASLKNVVINPSWGVPYSILVHDKIPKIINDPDYVRRSGFTVTDDTGNIIDPDQADWENEGSHYHLRQSPGSHNALGRVKFNIENPYTIYLHGTPEEKLFQKTARAFSSGCIRLKTPVDLAAWVLDDKEKWSANTIGQAIHKGGTQTVKPQIDIPVFFTYQTVWMGEDGLIYVSDDPYRLDPKMEKVMHPR